MRCETIRAPAIFRCRRGRQIFGRSSRPGSSQVTAQGGIRIAKAEGPLAPGWRIRLRLMAQDLLRFDRRRLGWALAARTVAGLALPMLLARAFGAPGLVYVGIGAYLIAIGDCVDDGDRGQPLRIAAGALLGAVALAAGVLAGGNLAAVVAGMLVFGLLAGMMGVYGDAFAAMALPVVWAYVELGAPAIDHSAANAMWLGAMFALGGALTLALTFGLRPAARLRPERVRAADCFQEVAHYLAGRVVAAGPVSAETEVRSTIASARRLASVSRGGADGANRVHQQTVVLIEFADRLFSLAGAMREAGLSPPPLAAEALEALRQSLEGRGDPRELRRLAAALAEPSMSETSAPRFDPGGLARRMAEELVRALRIAANEEATPPPFAAQASGRDLAALWSPLLDNLNPNSIVARHALRYALALAAAVVVFWLFPKPFGYWTPLTVTVVLKPYAGMTLERAVQRTIGTVIGVLAGLALMAVLPTTPLQFVATMGLFFVMMAVLPFNYSLAIVFLSAGLIPFEHVLNPSLHAAIGFDRLVATAIGAAIALAAGHLLWPTFDRRSLPERLRASARGMADYAEAAFAAAEGRGDADASEAARRRAGSALTDLHASLQRALTEIGGDPAVLAAMLQASFALQRLSSTLNALMNAAPGLAPARLPLEAFRRIFAPALAEPYSLDPPITRLRAEIRSADGSAEATFARKIASCLASELEMLREALAPCRSTTDAGNSPGI